MLIGGLIGLGFGAKWLVSGAVRLALRFGLSPGLVGVTIVAFGTSAPELIASVFAAAQGSVEMAFGNIVGSNIANIALVLGLTGFVKPMKSDPEQVRWDLPWLLISAGVLAAFTLWFVSPAKDGEAAHDFAITAWEGGVMVALFVAFIITNVIRARRHRNAPISDEVAEELEKLSESKAIIEVLVLILGLTVLTGGAYILVEGARGIALELGVSELIVGLTIVAFGTSLPELATSIIAARKGHSEMAIANVTGSNIQNILLCLGAAAIAAAAFGGIKVEYVSATEDMPVMVGVTLLLALFLVLGKITKGRAAFFAFLYFAYGVYIVLRDLGKLG